MNDLQKTFVAVKSAMDWMPEANCRNMDTKLFFPKLGGNISEFARDVCMSCPVIEECAWYANETSADHGVFGGMTPNQRRLWRRKNKVDMGQTRKDWENNRRYLHRPVKEWSKP